jgi:hypothetical protein
MATPAEHLAPAWLEHAACPDPRAERAPAPVVREVPANEPMPPPPLRFATRGTAATDAAGALWLALGVGLSAIFAFTLL